MVLDFSRESFEWSYTDPDVMFQFPPHHCAPYFLFIGKSKLVMSIMHTSVVSVILNSSLWSQVSIIISSIPMNSMNLYFSKICGSRALSGLFRQHIPNGRLFWVLEIHRRTNTQSLTLEDFSSQGGRQVCKKQMLFNVKRAIIKIVHGTVSPKGRAPYFGMREG